MRPYKTRWIKLMAAFVSGATMFQFGGCLTDAATFVANINPCGTILDCDPETYNFLTSGYEGPGADPSVDLNCVFPPYCDGAIVPAGQGTLP